MKQGFTAKVSFFFFLPQVRRNENDFNKNLVNGQIQCHFLLMDTAGSVDFPQWRVCHGGWGGMKDRCCGLSDETQSDETQAAMLTVEKTF